MAMVRSHAATAAKGISKAFFGGHGSEIPQDPMISFSDSSVRAPHCPRCGAVGVADQCPWHVRARRILTKIRQDTSKSGRRPTSSSTESRTRCVLRK